LTRAKTSWRTHSLGSRAEIEVLVVASIIQRLRRLVSDESGPTAVEYAVMLALIITVVIGSVRALGTNSNSAFQSSAQALDTSSGADGRTDGNQDGNGQY
jgi:pilus assembly protein Flp/PilA